MAEKIVATRKPTTAFLLHVIDPNDIIRKNKDVRIMYGATGWTVWNMLHTQWLRFEVGDYLNITNIRDVYPITRRTFEENFEVVSHGT